MREIPSARDQYRTAQLLVRSGQPVFPCYSGREDGNRTRAKRPYGSLVPHGAKDATLDLDVIKGWLRAAPTAALGIPTGILYDVLDVDIKETADGRVHMAQLHRLGLLNGCKKVARSPSGGLHLYFAAAPGMTNKARGAKIGLDVRGLGGYVLAPGSYIEAVNTEGLEYDGTYDELDPPIGGDDSPLYWDLIVSSLAPLNDDNNKPIPLLPAERRASLASLREFVSELRHGERNNGFFWAICRCVDNGIDPNELAEAASLTGLTDDEISKSIGSALSRAGLSVHELDSEGEALFDRIEDHE